MLYDTASWGQWGGQKARRRRRQLLRSIAKAARQPPASVGKRKRRKMTPRFPLLSAWARFMKREGVDDPEHANYQVVQLSCIERSNVTNKEEAISILLTCCSRERVYI